ncbi:hybrid sensor histidine kinase/response regulator [Cyanobacteria bacterium FACHB-502]|uniref:ATP-binding response regulator n=1 Tax=Leptolyngbya sp. GB1-A1 TaxID=2933908 RepID=UPI0019B8FD01|nr:hybrid sensor histidine kinase/response regulator [Cyanobacteria bacterium FACHB-502]
MATVRLKKFLVSVPAIAVTNSVAQAWEIFRQRGCEQIVVLDQQSYPIGVLRLLRLLPYLPPGVSPQFSKAGIRSGIRSADQQQETNSPAPTPAPTEAQQSIYQLCQTALQQGQMLLEDLTLLPADQQVNQLQPHLGQIHQQHWGMLDANHHFVGLVDRLSLLQFLSHQTPPLSVETVREPKRESKAGKTQQASKKRASAKEVKTVEEQWQASGTASRHSLAGKPTDGKPAAQKSVPLQPSAAPDPLVELLERLPIPLMLQTAAGQVIAQNLAWRQQIGELRDPHQVQCEAALALESAERHAVLSVETGSATAEKMPASVPPRLDAPAVERQSNRDWENWNATASQISPEADATGLCRIGTTPDACVCLCPMKNGQERIWQFMKVSMGTTSQPSATSPFSSRVNDAVSHWELESQADWLPQFKLATLSFNPDPNWYCLHQTESLWLVLAQDITEQQQVAKELAAKNADLVQLNRLKDEFLACISHELKTPLTAVLGLSSLLKEQALGALNDRQARYTQLIHQSGRHLIQIVNNILDLTRIETGQLDLLPEPVAIEEVCRRAYEQACQLQMVEQHTDSALPHHPPVRFTLNIQPDLHNLIADELRLRQMLTNLLTNAIKFTPLEGELGLRVETWEGWIAFTIWDTGIGIPAEKQHLIFQKFQQLESPMTRRFEGTGLGLVLTQRLARLHGGDVTFTSQEGRGSEFTLLLPPSPPQVMSHFRSPALNQAGHRNRIAIVIEADTLAVEGLTHQLMGLGYRAAIARSGTEALEKIRRLQPGIIFLNPILPLLSGWDVLTLLKTDPETQHIPVVVTTMRVEKDLAYQNGADGFLSLPVQVTALQACLDRLIKRTPIAIERSQSNLTVLYLNPAQGQQPTHLANQLHQQQCRVLEVEDLDQADLLARVWKPDVLLLDQNIADPASTLHQLSQSSCLANLPLVTLTVKATEAANHIPALRVFPCLSGAWDSPEEQLHCPLQDLLQVIQMAAGMNWTPHVLIVDYSQLAANPAVAQSSSLAETLALQFPEGSIASGSLKPQQESTEAIGRAEVNVPKLPHTPQAIAQYLQMAGLQSTVAQSWADVLHQLQHHSVNLLLFCVYPGHTPAQLPEMANELAQMPGKPPILVWNPQPISLGGEQPVPDAASLFAEQQQFVAFWQSFVLQLSKEGIATEVLPDGIPISKLLDRLQQILCHPIQ